MIEEVKGYRANGLLYQTKEQAARAILIRGLENLFPRWQSGCIQPQQFFPADIANNVPHVERLLEEYRMNCRESSNGIY